MKKLLSDKIVEALELGKRQFGPPPDSLVRQVRQRSMSAAG